MNASWMHPIRRGSNQAFLEEHQRRHRCFVLTDTQVAEALDLKLDPAYSMVLPPGEASKSLETCHAIWERLIALPLGRDGWILGIGGGVITDLAGFVGGVYLRGVPVGLVATSLMAQVDAALGGKNGVNAGGFKNMLGMIRAPRWVCCDPAHLGTLPADQYRAGLGEVFKYAVGFSPELMTLLERETDAVQTRCLRTLNRILEQTGAIKMDLVSLDPGDQGPRRRLNLGHTLGHALESVLGIPHGEAVALGLCAEARLARHLGVLDPSACRRIHQLAEALGFSTALPLELDRLLPALRRDKKNHQTRLGLILPTAVGVCREFALEEQQLEEAADDLHQL